MFKWVEVFKKNYGKVYNKIETTSNNAYSSQLRFQSFKMHSKIKNKNLNTHKYNCKTGIGLHLTV